MSTRHWGGMPCAAARSSVLTRTPSSTVANSTMARTAYSALADIRMRRILPGSPPGLPRRGDREAAAGQLASAYHQIGQQRVGPVVLERRAVDPRGVQSC